MKIGLWGVILTVFVFSFGGPGVAHAGGKIGVIDLQRIMKESKAAGDARGMFLMDIESKRGVLKKKEQEVMEMEKKLKMRETSTDPAAGKESNEDISRAIKQLRRLRDDMENELKRKERELIRKLSIEIRGIVREFIKKNKYHMVFERKVIFAFDDAIDVTDEIIELYDAQGR